MKKIARVSFIIIMAYSISSYAVFERVRPIQYTALSGRRLYIPAAPVRTEPLMSPSIYNPYEYEDEHIPHVGPRTVLDYDEAVERNRRLRLWQYDRAAKRRYGSYNYHRGSSAGPPIGITPETRPIDINDF